MPPSVPPRRLFFVGDGARRSQAVATSASRKEKGSFPGQPHGRGAMRSLSGSPDPALHPLALILAGVAAPVWGVAGLTLGLNLLVRGILLLALWASLSLV